MNNLKNAIPCSQIAEPLRNLLQTNQLWPKVKKKSQSINLIKNITINIRRIKIKEKKFPNQYHHPRPRSHWSNPLHRNKKLKTRRINLMIHINRTPQIKWMPLSSLWQTRASLLMLMLTLQKTKRITQSKQYKNQLKSKHRKLLIPPSKPMSLPMWLSTQPEWLRLRLTKPRRPKLTLQNQLNKVKWRH